MLLCSEQQIHLSGKLHACIYHMQGLYDCVFVYSYTICSRDKLHANANARGRDNICIVEKCALDLYPLCIYILYFWEIADKRNRIDSTCQDSDLDCRLGEESTKELQSQPPAQSSDRARSCAHPSWNFTLCHSKGIVKKLKRVYNVSSTC